MFLWLSQKGTWKRGYCDKTKKKHYWYYAAFVF